MAEGRPGARDGALEAGIRRGLFEMARRHVRGGRMYAAIESYLSLLRDHPDTVEGSEAGRALLSIARRYDAEGKRYHASSLYDKMATLLGYGQGSDFRPGFPRRRSDAPVEDRRRSGHRAFGGEIPFVDLTEDVRLVRNFEQLGRVYRIPAEGLQRAVEALRALKR
jgi:hypothetical protein